MNISSNLSEFLKTEKKWTPLAIDFFKIQESELYGERCLLMPFSEEGLRAYFFERVNKKERWMKHPTSNQSSGYMAGDLSGDNVYLVEGEWDLFAMFEAGIKNCITGTLGANSLPESINHVLKDKTVNILYDNDQAGINGQINAANKLKNHCKSIKVINWSKVVGHQAGQDVRDLILNLDFKKDLILESISRALEISENSISNEPEKKVHEITLDEKAYYGLIGEFVQEVDSFTEADPAAILFQCLVAIGCFIGVDFYCYAGGQQRAKLFTVAVGNSAKARKGTSWAIVRSLMEAIDLHFVNNQIIGGLGSGEAIISILKDKDEHSTTKHDPRLLISGGEFAQVLQVMNREGSTLSTVIREGWDNQPIFNIVKDKTTKVSNHHISIIAHITQEELITLFKTNDFTNGFGNRFLFYNSRRSKYLPFTKEISPEIFSKYGYAFRDKIADLRNNSKFKLEMSPSASTLWLEIYNDLSRDRYGQVGAILSRAEAQVTRIALIYAIMEGACWIDLPHLEAALAVWDYVEQSSARIFSSVTKGITNENKIIRVLTDNKTISRSEVYSLLGNNPSKDEIDRLRDSLSESGILRFKQISNFKGRPSEVWEYVYPTK